MSPPLPLLCRGRSDVLVSGMGEGVRGVCAGDQVANEPEVVVRSEVGDVNSPELLPPSLVVSHDASVGDMWDDAMGEGTGRGDASNIIGEKGTSSGFVRSSRRRRCEPLPLVFDGTARTASHAGLNRMSSAALAWICPASMA